MSGLSQGTGLRISAQIVEREKLVPNEITGWAHVCHLHETLFQMWNGPDNIIMALLTPRRAPVRPGLACLHCLPADDFARFA